MGVWVGVPTDGTIFVCYPLQMTQACLPNVQHPQLCLRAGGLQRQDSKLRSLLQVTKGQNFRVTIGFTGCVPTGTLRSLLPLDGFIVNNKE